MIERASGIYEAKTDNIRDVMAFPKVKDASCLMTEAPSQADDKQLEELGLLLRVGDPAAGRQR